jgi:cytochrome b6-f complex iron-sulfur subunit
MSCQDCINRRDFLTKSALAAAALVVLEGCGDGQIGPTIPHLSSGGDPFVPVSPAVTVKLSEKPGLATVGTVVDIGNQRALVRTGATTFLGLSRICTHQGCDTEVQNNQLACPCHGSLFSASGSVLRGPNIQSPPIVPLSHLAATFDPVANTVTVA